MDNLEINPFLLQQDEHDLLLSDSAAISSITENNEVAPNQAITGITLEAEEALNEARIVQSEAERAVDIHEAGTDLIRVAEKIEQATVGDVLMIDAANRLALAGTDIPAAEIAPSLESYVGTKISLESATEFLAKIWEAILNAVKNIWHSITEFMYKLFGTTPALRRQAKLIADKAKSVKNGSPIKLKINLSHQLNPLTLKHIPPTSGKQVQEAVRLMHMNVKPILHNYSEAVAKMGKGLATTIDDFQFDKMEESLDNVSALPLSLFENPKSFVKTMGEHSIKNDSRFASGNYYKSECFPGTFAVVLHKPKGSMASGESALFRAERARNTYFELVRWDAGKTTNVAPIEFPTVETSMIVKICDEVSDFCDSLDKYYRDYFQKMMESKDALSRSNNEMKKRIMKLESPTEALTDHYRSALKFLLSYTRWSTGIQSQLASHSHRTIRAALIVASSSLSRYE